ncbi:uncharacterized protein LOC128235729 [Mya arenaria]|uniref:uncharacterized protein LOC128235729 n=1 Tax=Mya arenaria TaxID=6604 RepID=UPI0022E46634|nr:uncharacterized protein LOC128235729 [Mya arenaria]
MDLPVSVIIFVLCCGMLIYGQGFYESAEDFVDWTETCIVHQHASSSLTLLDLSWFDNGLQIDFQRILEAGGSQSIDHIQVDSSSTDTFQVMCRVNSVNQLFRINTLRTQYKTSANTPDFTDLTILQNVDNANADTYQKPVLASGAGSGWTVEGSFDTTNSNGRDSTLGVSRPVSSIACSNAVEYRCHLTYTKPGPDYNTATGMKLKELDVKVLPTTITRNVYNMSGLGSFPITFVNMIEPFYVGQTVKMECSANIGSYNGTAQIRWLKSNLVAGSPLAPYYSPDAVVGDAQAMGNCVYQQADSVTYNMTAKDAGRTAESRLQFQCYVFIPSVNWETPEEQRQNFSFYVYTTEEGGSDSATTADNGLQIDFQRILEAGGSQTIEQIQVDNSSTDTIQVMCKVNNVDQLFKINNLRLQYKTSANAPDFTDLAFLQNVDDTNGDTYQKPVLASGADSSWTVEGRFDTTSSNGRESTLGVSRLVSSITCSNAVEYRCDLSYTMPGPEYSSETGIISNELDVQVLPTTITRNVYNMSSLSSSLPIALSDLIGPFYVGQSVKMECSANIGSYNGTAQIRWLKSNIVPGSPLAPYYIPDAVIGDPQSTGNCIYQQTDSVTYNMTAQDAARTAENRLHFQCYVYIPSMNWETPEDHRQNFKFIVYSRGKTSHDDTNDTDFDKESSSTGTVTGGVFGGVVGGVVVVAAVVVAVLIISRRYQFPCMQTPDNAKNTKIQANPVFETQAASPYEHLTTGEQTEYTEIGMTAVGQSGAGSPNNETSSYERLHTGENAAYTELGVYSPVSQTQFKSQQTDSHTASSNYEVPDNRVMM